jgi:release factor glutamine methyltransferase
MTHEISYISIALCRASAEQTVFIYAMLPAIQPHPQHKISSLDLWQWRQQAQFQAMEADIPTDELDWLLQAAGLDWLSLRFATDQQTELWLHWSLAELEQLWQQRIHHQVPVQYLAGETVWRKFLLTVSPAVLIPRPETELLIDLAKATPLSLQTGHWADLGTGSGAIALGLTDAFPTATIHAVDSSAAALQVAQQNAQRLSLSVQFYHGSWFTPLAHLRSQLSAMISNPPYIPSRMIAELQPEVAHHEPHSALDGGVDGLDCIRELVTQAPEFLISGGLWLIESMAGQAADVIRLLERQGQYRDLQIHRDLAGIERFVLAYRR